MLHPYELEQSFYTLQERRQKEAASLRLLKSLPPQQLPIVRMMEALSKGLNALKEHWHMQSRPRRAPSRSNVSALMNHE
jgi:hypothetical protein